MTNAITTITRLFAGSEDNVTITIPCLKKKSKNPHTKTVVHVGRLNDEGNPICLCSQQEKDNKKYSDKDYAPSDAADWRNADVDEYPSITCKSCIRSGAFSGDGESVAIHYLANKLEMKVEAMKEYEKPEPCESPKHNTSTTPEPEPLARMLPGSDHIAINAIIERRCGEFAVTTPPVHVAIFDNRVPGGIPLCMKDDNMVHLSSFYTANYTSHPSITCPACAELQRKRGVESEPKRDKSLVMRKAMLAAEKERINKNENLLKVLRETSMQLLIVGMPPSMPVEVIHNLTLEHNQSVKNFILMNQSIIKTIA